MIPPLLLALAASAAPLRDESFRIAQPCEVVAVLTASCERCGWGRKGREAAALSLAVDGRYSQHLLLFQGEAASQYRVALGSVAPGAHRLTVGVDREASAGGIRRVSVDKIELLTVPAGAGEHVALAHAPILHPTADSFARFTDVPLLLWYESEPTPLGSRIRYSAVMSGAQAPPDRLMAAWGRVTEIVAVYSVELDASGRVLAEELSGPDATPVPFRGAHEGLHPLVWVATPGDGPRDLGEARRRYAPAPFAFGFVGAPREAVMDAHPWTYRVMIQEAARKGLLVADARQGSGRIPDPRRFAYVEACGELTDAALSLEVGVSGRGGRMRWRASDEGGPEFRIERSGCFRSAVALGSPAEASSIQALRFRAFARSREAAASGSGSVRLTRLNRLFVLGSEGTPGPNLLTWTGDATLRAGDAPYTLPLATDR